MIITIDFETQDPYIDRGLGSGWVYGVNIQCSDFEILGASIKIDDGETYYETDMEKLKKAIPKATTLVMHNAQYDLGCLKYIGFDFDSHTIVDTEVMSRLYDSSRLTHGLDALAKYHLKSKKTHDALVGSIIKNDLFPWTKRELKEKDKAEKAGEVYVRQVDEKKALKFAKANMRLIQHVDLDTVAMYANMDVDLTYGLYNFFKQHLDMELVERYSGLARVCMDYRSRGVRVDLVKAREIRDKLHLDIEGKYREVFNCAGEDFNINSAAQVAKVFDKLKIGYPLTEKGNPSVTTPWMSTQTHHPICAAIVDVRKYVKITRDFIEKIIDMQEFTCPGAEDTGRVYPELHLLRARTGRFSCTNPNIQQIPSRDKILGPLCRSIFLPEEGEKWFSLDYSNQEGRIQVHYASLLGCEGADELRLQFRQNPRLDLHQKVANMANIDRTHAKVINLGISYGMGLSKLAKSLSISVAQAKELKAQYDTSAPYLKQLNDKCKESLKSKGYIKTLGGRKSTIDPPAFIDGERKTFEYKALNKLIQGSAADQTIVAMQMAYAMGLKVIFPVHDQLCLTGTKKDAEALQYIMESAIILQVPTVVDVDLDGGSNWTEAGH